MASKHFTRQLAAVVTGCLTIAGICQAQDGTEKPVPGKDGDKYVPYEERTGNESIVYFTRNLDAEGLIRAYRSATADALACAEIIEKTASVRYRLSFGYSGMNSVMKVLKDLGLQADKRDFGMECSLETDVRLGLEGTFRELIGKTEGCSAEIIG